MYDDTNKKVIGKFKDEAIDDSVSYIKEFVGLRSKLYSYSIELDNKINEEHKCKGIKKSVISKDLSTALYKEILFNRQNYKVNQNGFRSHKHQIFTEQISKIALSANDDKCFITNNNVITYTHGHYKIMK
jgi:hypothetical protein